MNSLTYRVLSAGLRTMIVTGLLTCRTMGAPGPAPVAGSTPADPAGAGGTSGAALWTFQVPDGKGLTAPSQAMSKVAAQFGMVDRGILYCSSYNGHVYKLDLQTGKLLADWKVSAGGCYSAPLRVGDAWRGPFAGVGQNVVPGLVFIVFHADFR